jgi:PAS domain S-box-containing protein
MEGLRKEGASFPVELSVSPWRSRDRLFFTAVVRDITERKKAERALAEEKRLLDVTLGSIADGVVTTDAEGRILLLNSAAAGLTGWSHAEALGKELDKVLHLVDPRSMESRESPFQTVIRTGHLHGPLEAVVVSAGGQEHNVTVAGAPIRDSDNNVVGAVLALRDITEKQRIEEELFKARKLESVGLLAGGIAHDFNNILTGIVTNLFMAKMGLKKGEEAYQLINEAEAATFRASKLTKQLLTFAQGGAPVKEAVSIRELIEESVGFSLSGSNVDCTLQLPDDLWAVDIDRGQIDQVLNNLIVNADQAMPEGGTVTVTAENIVVDDEISDNTEVRLPLGPGNYVKVSIKDQGVGISRKNLQRIFDPYFTTKKNASGLGLTTIFSIVQKHGGFITAKSALGKGSTFVFYLPASSAEEEEEDAVVLPVGAARILVMDDDEVVRAVIEKLLLNAGHAVQCVTNGDDAVAAYTDAMREGERFDAVIMDLTIPGGKGGKDTVKELLTVDPEARVIVASGYSNDPIMSEYEKYGFRGVIKKPFSIEEFSRVIKSVVN